ncbi:amidase domain-containing protein [Streptomyces lavendulocolor]|uniref:amidase domain-containing protein n=1 Tax=Streptomyces lavendulocolor TaxID=67316 RepID=UPI003C2BAFBF
MAGVVAPAAHAEEVPVTPTAKDTAQLSEIADSYLQKRADAVTVTGAAQRRGLSAPQNVTDELAGVIEEDFAALADQGRVLKEVNGGYTRAEVDVTVDSTAVTGDTATVEVTEDTRLYYPDVHPDEPEYEEYSLPHTLTYTRAADGGWLLADDKAKVDPTGPAPTTQITEPIDAPAPDSEDEGPKDPASQTPPPADGVTATPRAANYSKMAAYADRHWKNTNSDYRVYPNDCTNFISQAMRAGGWGMTSGSAMTRKDNRKWFYGSFTWTTSYTWAGAENWYWFAIKHSKRTRALTNVWHLAMADVLQADWKRDGILDHTMIVTKRSKNEVFLTYHTPSTHNKKLSTILAQYPRATWYAHRT